MSGLVRQGFGQGGGGHGTLLLFCLSSLLFGTLAFASGAVVGGLYILA